MHVETNTELHLEPVVITDRSTILIIEDDPLQIDLLQDGLTRQGFHVLSSTTGNKGLKLAKSEIPDVIILDLSLPDADGFDLCERLADDSVTSQIPIIVVSGNSQKDVVRQSRARGGKFFLHKPYDPNALLLLITKAIDDQISWY